jgi:YVTN family beta-propeller protein
MQTKWSIAALCKRSWVVLVISCILVVLGVSLLGVGVAASSREGMASSDDVAVAFPSYAYTPLLTLHLPDGIGDGPRAVAGNPATGLVYVANHESDDVSVISGTRFLATVPGGSRPRALAADPASGYTYVLSDYTADVQILSGTVHVGAVPIPSRANAVTVDSQRSYAYILDSLNNIAVMRGTEVITTVHVPTTSGSLRDIAVNPTTGLLYALSSFYDGEEVTATVVIISGTAVAAEVPLGEGYPQSLAVDPLHGYIYAGSGGTAPAVTVLSGTAAITTVPVLSVPWQIAVDPERGLAYVQCDEQIRVLSGTQVLGDVSTQPYYVPTLQVEPATGYLYATLCDLADGSYRLLILQGTTEIARVPLTEGSMVMGADGRGHVYLAHSSNYLSVWQGTALVGRIPSRASPARFLADPARGYTYIANGEGSDTVTVVSGTAILANLPVGYGPMQIEPLAERGLVYVASKEEPGISVLRGTEVLATVPVTLSRPWTGGYPHLAVEPQRGWAYATFSWDSPIHVFSGTALLTTIPITHVYDLAADPLTGNLLVGGLDYQGLVVISGTEVISHVVMPWYIEDLEADLRNGYVYAFSYYEWWALRAGEPVQSMGDAPDAVRVQPYSGLLYVLDGMTLTVFSGTHGLASTDWGFSWPHDIYGDAGSDRLYMLYDYLGPGEELQVWRGAERVTVQSGLPYSTRIGSSPGGAYLYLTSSDHLEVWREVSLPYHFYMPVLVRGSP